MAAFSNVWTISQMERDTGLPRHRVLYVIESRHIKPVAKVGNTNVYDDNDYQRIKSELKRIAGDRRGIGGVL